MSAMPIAIWGNLDSGHGPFPPTPAILGIAKGGETTKSAFNPFSASGNVVAGKKGVHRQWDVRILHISLTAPAFPPEIVVNAMAYNGGPLPFTKDGSRSVIVNGVPCARLGSKVICTSSIIAGVDKTVLVGE